MYRFKITSTNVLIIVNAIFFLIAFLLSQIVISQLNTQNIFSVFAILGGYSTSLVNNGEFFRLLTANFLHFEFVHFLINAYSLYVIGRAVEVLYGSRKVLITYVFTGICGYLLFHLIQNSIGIDAQSLGASASVFGLLGVLVGGILKPNRFGRDLPISFRDLLPSVVLSFAYGLIPGTNVNNLAHLGGFLSGVLLGYLMTSSLNLSSRTEKFLEKFFFYFSIFIILVAYILLGVSVISLISSL